MISVVVTRLLVSLVMILSIRICLQDLSAADNTTRGLIGQYCTTCHNDNLRTAGVSLQGLDPADVSQHPALWEKVLRKVSSGEMPPPKMPAPDAATSEGFVTKLKESLDLLAAASPDPGRPVVHRLNRAEYSNSVRDLLSFDLDVSTMLPADDSGYGFDNIGDVLTLSPALLDRYMIAARRISRLVIGSGSKKPQRIVYVRNRETGFLDAGHNPGSSQDLPFGTNRGAAFTYYFPFEGEYVISLALDGGDSRTDYEPRELRQRVDAGMHTLLFAFLRESSKFERTRPDSGADESPHPPVDVRLDGKRLQLFELPASSIPFKIRWIAIDGPYLVKGAGDTPSRQKVFSCHPASESEEQPCAKQILARLARSAYRRPVDNEDLGALMAIYDMSKAKDGFERGVERALQALLVSPSFLFQLENDPDGIEPGTPYHISDIELASRLSFFLWSSLPDEELLSLAEAGRLQDPAEFERQVRRMLADRRSWALVENFAGQWLELRNLAKAKPDKDLFPEFDTDLRLAMKRETELFFADVLGKNRSVLELLDSNRTFLNDKLAEHYGLEKVYGSQFREVQLNNPERGGLLGQGSILTVTSYPNRTSVVIRGKWILENLFGMPPPPPPPDLPELEEANQDGEQRTLRELMALHSKSPTCSSCHVRMDPIGFALENFDAIGRWREVDAGVPIDASGELPGGMIFDGPAELKRVLATNLQEAFTTTLVTKMLMYALGRGLEYYDKPTVRSIVRDAARNDYRLADLIVNVVKSIPFRMRKSAEL